MSGLKTRLGARAGLAAHDPTRLAEGQKSGGSKAGNLGVEDVATIRAPRTPGRRHLSLAAAQAGPALQRTM